MRLNDNLKIVQDFLSATDELLEFTKDIKTISLYSLMLTCVPEIQ
jgi:hypothetical protein